MTLDVTASAAAVAAFPRASGGSTSGGARIEDHKENGQHDERRAKKGHLDREMIHGSAVSGKPAPVNPGHILRLGLGPETHLAVGLDFSQRCKAGDCREGQCRYDKVSLEFRVQGQDPLYVAQVELAEPGEPADQRHADQDHCNDRPFGRRRLRRQTSANRIGHIEFAETPIHVSSPAITAAYCRNLMNTART